MRRAAGREGLESNDDDMEEEEMRLHNEERDSGEGKSQDLFHSQPRALLNKIFTRAYAALDQG